MELPTPESVEYKSKQWLLTLEEQWGSSSKIWFIILAVVIVGAFALKPALAKYFDSRLVGVYQPPVVFDPTAGARDLAVLRAEALSAPGTDIYSAYAQVQNPNPALSARDFEYHFVITDGAGDAAPQPSRHSYVLGGESRFLLLPSLRASSAPSKVEVVIDRVRWSARTAAPVRFEILQKRSGLNSEGNFFAEALVKNTQAWRLRKVDVQVLVFDRNAKIIAVNAGEISDLQPFESRYLRVLWPKAISGAEQIEILPLVNPLDPGAVVDIESEIPAR